MGTGLVVVELVWHHSTARPRKPTIIRKDLGPTAFSVGARMNREKRSKHSKVLGVYFTYVGAKTPGRIDP